MTTTLQPQAPESAPASASAPAPDDVLTASPRSVLRRRAVWIVLAVVVLLGVLVVIIAQGSGPTADEPLSATNPKPDGSMALVQVLAQHGVHVVVADSAREARQASARATGGATVLLFDPQALMTPEQRQSIMGLGDDVVAVEPDLLAISDIIPGVGVTGELSGRFTADCAVDAVRRAGTVTAAGLGYRITDASRNPVACLGKKGASGLVQAQIDRQSVTVLGLGTALENGTIGTRGDAALALNLLGAHPTLIWYISTYADLQTSPTPSLANLTPLWATPLMALLVIAGIAAAVWRGRRFGPIVVENLPVVVRASETMEGRARLYSRARARLRALDALRIGTVARLARAVGLPRTATVDEVVSAVAAQSSRDRTEVAGILIDTVPRSDAELVRLSDELLQLEAAIATTRPGSAASTQTAPPTPEQNGQHG